MDRLRILNEIKRLAGAEGGKPPGEDAFERKMGIRRAEWYPRFWLRWSEALAEAGFAPNKFQAAFPPDFLCAKFIALARDLRHLPVTGELRRKAEADKSFPSHNVFSRFGGKDKFLQMVLEYCQRHPGNDDMVDMLGAREPMTMPDDKNTEKVRTGCVYLMKSGRHYKIGRTNCLGVRERQLAIQIPIPPTTIHSIETDDPTGVEAYWHRRFETKRGEGEWFDLAPEDVRAFKRWKRIA